jgi:outer membrane lipoprotein-sorting protein
MKRYTQVAKATHTIASLQSTRAAHYAILVMAALLLFAAAPPKSDAQEAAGAVTALSAAAVLARLDSNESFRSISYSGRMEITIGGETRYKTMDSIAQGADKAFSEFTNPEDRGVRYLKIGKELWIYFPKEQDTVKISGHLLKEGMMGSDLSYEDALESRDFTAKYSAAVRGREAVDGRDCYVIALDAKAPAELPKGSSPAAYDRRVLWIDAERFVSLKQEMYAKSGKLLKVSKTLEVARVGGRWYPTRTQFESRLRSNTKTVFSMTRIEIDVPVDAKRFSMAALTK